MLSYHDDSLLTIRRQSHWGRTGGVGATVGGGKHRHASGSGDLPVVCFFGWCPNRHSAEEVNRLPLNKTSVGVIDHNYY